MRVNTTKFTGYVLIALAILIVLAVFYRNSERRYVPLVFSPKAMLGSIWEHYKEDYLEEGTFRAIDRQRNDITTSEGQSYTMLRSVWLDDKETFDGSWQWTKDNLQMSNDLRIFSWLFGRKSDGTFGIITELGGQNSAADADTDIALALIFAYARWKEPTYLGDARVLLADIWQEEVIEIGGKPYLAASNIERQYQDEVVVNPSYYSPYAYRIFAAIDPERNWMGVLDTSYDVLERSMTANLDKNGSARLPPNWIGIRRSDGAIVALTDQNLTTDYSYDALRTSWRLALDWKWNDEPRATRLLAMMGAKLEDDWRMRGSIVSEYSHSGERLTEAETPAMYGGSLGALMARDTSFAKAVYESKLQSLYNPDIDSWKEQLSYYDDNWAWFGMALYHDELPNLWKEIEEEIRRGESP